MPRPLTCLAVALAMGIALAHWIRPAPLLPVALTLATFVVAVALWHRCHARVLMPALLLATLLLGAWRYAAVRTMDPGPLMDLLDQTVTVTATVESGRYSADAARWTGLISVESVQVGGGLDGPDAASPTRGLVWVEARWRGIDTPPPGPGRRVTVTGRLDLPSKARYPGGYDQREQLARRGVFLYLRAEAPGSRALGPVMDLGWGDAPFWTRWATAVRQRLTATLHRHLPANEAGLLAGMVFGDKGAVPGDRLADFKDAGIVHLLVVSGAHVGALAAGLVWMLGWLGLERLRAGLLVLPVLLAYCLVTGGAPPVVRATVMASVYFTGRAFLRSNDGYSSLAAAALLLLLSSPGLLLDAGFQLSFGATWGLMALGAPLSAYLRRVLAPPVAGSLAMTLAASAGILPLLYLHFGQVSVVAPLANLLVAPLALPLVPLGLFLVPLAVLSPLLGALLQPLAWLVRLLALVATAMAHVPGAVWDPAALDGDGGAVALPPWGVAVWYALLAGLRWRSVWQPWLSGQRWVPGARTWLSRAGVWLPWRRAARATLPLLLLATATFAAGASLARGPGVPPVPGPGASATRPGPGAGPPGAAAPALHVHFLDVGQGDATLVRFPSGQALLVDAGWADTGGRGTDYGRQVVVPALRRLGVTHLTVVAASHADQDHVGGLAAVVAAVPVGEIWEPGVAGDSDGYARLIHLAAERGVPVRRPRSGEAFAFGEAVVEVLHPGPYNVPGVADDDTNAHSLVLRITYGRFRLLLTGDVTAEAERVLLARTPEALAATVLKVAHHGSAGSSTTAFLVAVRPQLAVIPVGANRFGHPAPPVLARLERLGVRVLRADRHGEVAVVSDGYGWTARAALLPPHSAGRRLVGAW